jgi:predicted ATP-dependent protease
MFPSNTVVGGVPAKIIKIIKFKNAFSGTVIIPNYNHRKLSSNKRIESVLCQTFQGFEIIIFLMMLQQIAVWVFFK